MKLVINRVGMVCCKYLLMGFHTVTFILLPVRTETNGFEVGKQTLFSRKPVTTCLAN